MTTNTLVECAECEDVWRAAKCVRVPGRYHEEPDTWYCTVCAGDQIANDRAALGVLRQQRDTANRYQTLRLRRLSELADRADMIAVEGESVRSGPCAEVMHQMKDAIRSLEEEL